MLYLRLACLVAGFLVLLAPPVLMYPTGALPNEQVAAAGMLLALVLASASFFFIAFNGHRIRYSPSLQRLCVPLLGVSFLSAVAALWHSAAPAALWMSGMLLGFTLIVSAILASPLLQDPSPRRIRAREVSLRRG